MRHFGQLYGGGQGGSDVSIISRQSLVDTHDNIVNNNDDDDDAVIT